MGYDGVRCWKVMRSEEGRRTSECSAEEWASVLGGVWLYGGQDEVRSCQNWRRPSQERSAG